MLRNWIMYILALLAATCFFLFYKMWLSWYILVLLLLLIPVSLICTMIFGLCFKLHANAILTVRREEEAEITFTSSGLLYFPYARYRAHIAVREIMTSEEYELRLFSHVNTTEKIQLDTTHCGAYQLTPGRVRIYDLFGLFFFSKKIPFKSEVLVLPTPSLPPRLPDVNGFKAKDLRRSNAPYTEIYDMREYMPGDPIKRIHWKLSAKKDKLMVKEAQEESSGHSRLYLPLTTDRDILDRNLGEVLFTSEYLLKQGIDHKIRVLPPMKREIAFDVTCDKDLSDAMLKILHLPFPPEEEEEEEDV